MENLKILVCSEKIISGDILLREIFEELKKLDILVEFEFTYFYDDIQNYEKSGFQCVLLDQRIFQSDVEMMKFLSPGKYLNKFIKLIFILEDKFKGNALLSDFIDMGYNYGIFLSDIRAKTLVSLILNKRLDITTYSYYDIDYREKKKKIESDKLRSIIEYLDSSIDEYLDDDYNYISSLLNEEENIILLKNLSSETGIKLKNNERYKSFSKWIVKERASSEILVEKEVVKYREVQIGYKKQIITVIDNYNFALELAYLVAKSTDYRVMIIDGDRLNPCLDLVIDVESKSLLNTDFIQYSSKSGMNMALESIDKNFNSREYIEELSRSPKGLDNLHILTGNYDLNNYEYYENDNYIRLLDSLYSYYDLVVISANKFIYDAYTCISLLKSDINIVPIKPRLDKIRELNSYIVFLNEKQNISKDKYKFVGFDFNEKVHLDSKIMKKLTENNYIGTISYDEKRERLISDTGYYVRKNYNRLLTEYEEILDYLKIVKKKKGFFNRIMKR